jgi:hypothetical protein
MQARAHTETQAPRSLALDIRLGDEAGGDESGGQA